MNDTKLNRIPPGQHVTKQFPVLQHGRVVHLDREDYTLEITGLVQLPTMLDLDGILALPRTTRTVDIHCVTSWSKLDTKWGGVQFREITALVKPLKEARHVIMHCADGGFTTSLPIEPMMDDDVLLAYEYNGKPLNDAHGGPVRVLVPKRYFYKSAKWLTGLEFTKEDSLGFWERGGYSNSADPWKEERYA
ncbi:molybdopterin-dependent oxidoreductase [Candidatus Bathyarchaeota archaeon]|nr:molybdopterin-dependent oxidoreductase [Candidatus Bathyarchaeota archaeon]